MKPISPSSDNSPAPDSGATDSLWQPSWWRWLISALSGTVETEKQIAWLKKNNEELKKNERSATHEQRMNEEAEHRRAEAKEQATRRARVEIERDLAFLSFLADPSEQNQQRLSQVLALLNEYRDTYSPARLFRHFVATAATWDGRPPTAKCSSGNVGVT
jgi:hypothetical protein